MATGECKYHKSVIATRTLGKVTLSRDEKSCYFFSEEDGLDSFFDSLLFSDFFSGWDSDFDSEDEETSDPALEDAPPFLA
jgi:hypothetical protein